MNKFTIMFAGAVGVPRLIANPFDVPETLEACKKYATMACAHLGPQYYTVSIFDGDDTNVYQAAIARQEPVLVETKR